ncbi:hypothetical protein JM84_1660 [Dokdonia sp. Hel_I_63]|jgi:hypothetical protein|uniref:DUF2059 domain-containing protein n=1 Tax=Dokdonia sp. Hel_I_63 TaxID=1249996 RepID=UPI00119BEB82|nr:DUF2059 domain-containing protein [Dokdonia sp. Hel_I_63]TVZ22750.1 hypothetical protein JM84_1660 [Dokdonia sp. Hel_I_63]
MMKKLYIALFLLTSLSGYAQEKTYHEEVLRYFQVNGTADQYSNATKGLFDLLKNQYASKNVPEAVWNELKTETPKQVDRVLNMLVSAYRGSYNQEDIQNMLAFYETDAGRQTLTDKTALNYEQQKEIAVFYNTPTGQKILTVEPDIAQNIGEISEIWSRDLYRMMVDKLAEKGYTM